MTVALQASAHTWLPVSTAFTCAPLVVFQNLWPQQMVHIIPGPNRYRRNAWSHGKHAACPLCHGVSCSNHLYKPVGSGLQQDQTTKQLPSHMQKQCLAHGSYQNQKSISAAISLMAARLTWRGRCRRYAPADGPVKASEPQNLQPETLSSSMIAGAPDVAVGGAAAGSQQAGLVRRPRQRLDRRRVLAQAPQRRRARARARQPHRDRVVVAAAGQLRAAGRPLRAGRGGVSERKGLSTACSQSMLHCAVVARWPNALTGRPLRQ